MKCCVFNSAEYSISALNICNRLQIERKKVLFHLTIVTELLVTTEEALLDSSHKSNRIYDGVEAETRKSQASF